jgi:hypothetical protein
LTRKKHFYNKIKGFEEIEAVQNPEERVNELRSNLHLIKIVWLESFF